MKVTAIVLILLIVACLFFMEWITWSDILKLALATLIGALFLLALPHGM